jgi:hypothetical protein
MEPDPSEIETKKLNEKLDALLAAYRAACADRDPSPEFMPRLWERIEARRSVTYSLRRWAQAFVTAAAVICLLLGFLLTTASRQPSPVDRSTYVEALAADVPSENYGYLELVSSDNGGGGNYR